MSPNLQRYKKMNKKKKKLPYSKLSVHLFLLYLNLKAFADSLRVLDGGCVVYTSVKKEEWIQKKKIEPTSLDKALSFCPLNIACRLMRRKLGIYTPCSLVYMKRKKSNFSSFLVKVEHAFFAILRLICFFFE